MNPDPYSDLSKLSCGDKIGNDKVGVILDTTTYDPNADLFSDLTEINKILNWQDSCEYHNNRHYLEPVKLNPCHIVLP